VQKLDKGVAAPFSGWLITDKIAQDTARNIDLLEAKEKQVLKLEHLRVLDAGDMEHYKKRSNALEDRLHKEENKRTIHTAGAFVLGVLLTGIAAKAAIESTR
jgi:hypothetical protein